MKRSYSREEASLIDDYLKALFEQNVALFAAEAHKDFTKKPDRSYRDDHMQTLWIGFAMNFMIVRHSHSGDSIDLKPGLLGQAYHFFAECDGNCCL